MIMFIGQRNGLGTIVCYKTCTA